MYHMHSQNLLSQNQYGFTPQTSTVDAVMDLKDYAQKSMEEDQYVALMSLDVRGRRFCLVACNNILVKEVKCPRILYTLCGSYFSGRSAAIIVHSRKEQRTISRGCSQGSGSGPGF